MTKVITRKVPIARLGMKRGSLAPKSVFISVLPNARSTPGAKLSAVSVCRRALNARDGRPCRRTPKRVDCIGLRSVAALFHSTRIKKKTSSDFVGCLQDESQIRLRTLLLTSAALVIVELDKFYYPKRQQSSAALTLTANGNARVASRRVNHRRWRASR